MPQPTCHWRTAESIPGKGDVRAPEQLNLTCESMALPSSPCTLYTSPPRTRTCRQQFAPPLCACSHCTPKLWKLFGGWSLHSKALEALWQVEPWLHLPCNEEHALIGCARALHCPAYSDHTVAVTNAGGS